MQPSTLKVQSIYPAEELKNYATYKAQFKKYDTGMCSLPIDKLTPIFKCFDCAGGILNLCICKSCFENGQHRGHRIHISYKPHLDATCDCGDANFPARLKCSQHDGEVKIQENPILPPDSVAAMLANLAENLEVVFALFQSQHEQVQRARQPDQRKKSESSQSLSLDNIGDELELNNELLLGTLQELRTLLHDFPYLLKPVSELLIDARGFLDQFFRFKPYYSDGVQDLLTNILKELMINFSYKIQLLEKYTLNFESLMEKSSCNSMVNFYPQFFSGKLVLRIYQDDLFHAKVCGFLSR